MFSIGIDIGYSAIKLSIVNSNGKAIYHKFKLHKGKIKEYLIEIIEEVLKEYNYKDIRYGALTGNGSKKIAKMSSLEFIEEIPAMVEASLAFDKNIKSIIHIGGQSAKFITGINKEDQSKIEIAMNSNCAAGTGSFLEEQISRLNLKLEDYSLYASRAKKIPRIAGRCSVFAKTDITHHQQEGTSVDDILLGLAYAMIRNYKGSVIRKLPIKKPILFTGGVAYNQGIIIAIKDILDLKDSDLVIPKNPINIVAEGAANSAFKERMPFDIQALLTLLQKKESESKEATTVLPLDLYKKDDAKDKHICTIIKENKKDIACYLGIDIGSTSTNLVLINKNNEILAYEYLKTYGKPIETIQKGLKALKEKCDKHIKIIGTGITGSGRYMIGRMLKVDIIKDEITAQAKAAITIDSSVDTIFEIGGQDSKYICLQNGVVTDFQMNKICAAGTGSFIEEQAKKFNIPINDFGKVALRSQNPIELGERCTVFIETSIAASVSKGGKIEDVAAGLCYSIVQNYLNKVVGKKKIGNKVFFQGGVAYNQGVVNAFRNLIGDKIVVPPFFSVTGAYGVAIIASEEMGAEKTQFVGLNEDIVFNTEENSVKERENQVTSFDRKIKKFIFDDYDGSIDPKKKTVGIPRALFTFGMFPLYHQFFKELGLNVLLSSETNENIVRLCQEYSMEETCFPLKLLNGHIAELIEKKVDYIFIPDLYTADHPKSQSRKNYGCAYMQLAFKMINQSMELEKKGILLLSPTLAPNLGAEFMKTTFIKLGKVLDRSSEDIIKALEKGFTAVGKFKMNLEENAKNNIKKIDDEKLTFVIISKIYGVLDPVLNIGVAKKLENMGYNVISFTDLMQCDIHDDYPNMYWPFSQHILGAAKYVKRKPNMYAVFLTHHGCGPDSVVSHYFRKEMQGKPYLNIEVDEHASDVGVITRVEAFVNSLKGARTSDKEIHEDKAKSKIEGSKILYLQYMYPYAELFKEILIRRGTQAEVLPITCKESLAMGRKYTYVQEYYSLTALLGDVFKKVQEENIKGKESNLEFLIYRTEGSEVEGQYSRLVRTILDEEGVSNVGIVEPFIEDLIEREDQEYRKICMCFLAGDIIRMVDQAQRNYYLSRVVNLIKNDTFELAELSVMAKEVSRDIESREYNKKIFVTGEATVMFNDFLNNGTFRNLEEQNHRIIYSSMSEYMWMIWGDSLREKQGDIARLQDRLDGFKKMIHLIGECFIGASPFEPELDTLTELAQQTMGYYAGANGRYRGAKISTPLKEIEGILTVNSMYENTGVALNVVQRGFKKENNLPILNLTFDGNENENDKSKLASFLYYL